MRIRNVAILMNMAVVLFWVSCDSSSEDNDESVEGADVKGAMRSGEETADTSEQSEGVSDLPPGWLCPDALEACYSEYPNGNECQPGQVFIRYFYVDKEPMAQCWPDGFDETLRCTYYEDQVSEIAYCCNGYIANRTVAVGSYQAPFECCFDSFCSPDDSACGHEGLESSTFDAGRLLPIGLSKVPETNLFCAQWFADETAVGANYVSDIPGASVKITSAISMADLDGNERIYCSQSENDEATFVSISSDGPYPGGDWVLSSGEQCYHVQDDIYSW